jgi:hypothetical protein
MANVVDNSGRDTASLQDSALLDPRTRNVQTTLAINLLCAYRKALHKRVGRANFYALYKSTGRERLHTTQTQRTCQNRWTRSNI